MIVFAVGIGELLVCGICLYLLGAWWVKREN